MHLVSLPSPTPKIPPPYQRPTNHPLFSSVPALILPHSAPNSVSSLGPSRLTEVG